MSKPSIPLSRAVAYAAGMFGWALVLNIIINYLVYIYLPPEDAGLPELIPNIKLFGIISLIGLITMGSRLLDAITDPWIASLSDRSRSRRGRRISFMAAGGFPMVVLMLLVYFPPSSELGMLNLVWLTVTLYLFYIFFTVYAVPHNALIAELGHTPAERLNLCTYLSIAWFLGAVIAAQAPIFYELLMDTAGISKIAAIRLTFSVMGAVALICLYLPVFLVDEKRYSSGQPSSISMIHSFKLTFKNKPFIIFAFSDLTYWFFMTILQTGLIYYITVLLRQEETFFSTIYLLLMAGSFACYPLVNFAAKAIGKKAVLVISFFLFITVMSFVMFAGIDLVPLALPLQGYLLAAVAFFPLAAFGILPNAIIADIAENEGLRTGSYREGMFYAARNFMMKVGQMLAILVFVSLLTFGKDAGNDLGLRLSGLVGAAFCTAGLVIFIFYNEKHLLRESSWLKEQNEPAEDLTVDRAQKPCLNEDKGGI
ncbi:MAG: MFS transporter [Bacillota bacterium]